MGVSQNSTEVRGSSASTMEEVVEEGCWVQVDNNSIGLDCPWK